MRQGVLGMMDRSRTEDQDTHSHTSSDLAGVGDRIRYEPTDGVRLRDLADGDSLRLRSRAGTVLTFKVTGRRSFYRTGLAVVEKAGHVDQDNEVTVLPEGEWVPSRIWIDRRIQVNRPITIPLDATGAIPTAFTISALSSVERSIP